MRAPATETAQQARLLAKSSSGSGRSQPDSVGSRRARPDLHRARARGHAGLAGRGGRGRAARRSWTPPTANGLVWTDAADPEGLGAAARRTHPQIEWVQLPWAGIEPYVDVVRAHAERTWTCGKGVYAEPVAEHALALALAGLRQVGALRAGRRRGRAARASTCSAPGWWCSAAAGSPRACCACSGPFGCDVTVVRRSPRADGRREPGGGGGRARRRRSTARRSSCSPWPSPRRPTGILDRRRLELLAPDAWVVNVARGAPHRHRRPRRGARRGRASAARRSTSPTPSRCPTTTRSGRSLAASSRRTPPTPSRWRSRCSASGCGRTCAAASRARRCSGSVDPAGRLLSRQRSRAGRRSVGGHGLPHHHRRRPRRRRRAPSAPPPASWWAPPSTGSRRSTRG